MMPGGVPLEPAPPTNELAPRSSQKKTIFVLASLVVILLIAVVGMGIFMFVNDSNGTPAPPTEIASPPPGGLANPPSGPAIAIPEPPEPPEPPTARADTDINPDLKYPGARTVMDMNSGVEGHVTQMQARAPIEKVVEWYVAKLKPTKRVTLPGGGAVLKNKGITAVITGGEGEAMILIKQGGDD